MPQAPAQPFSRIFLSYRRDDSAGHAGRLFDRLAEHFGKEQLFMDVDDIELGEDFVQVIEAAVNSSAVLLVVIGRRWLAGGDATTHRLDNPNDFVRLEVAAALARNIRVIPVLVQDASMPRPQDLPDDIASLSRRNAISLSDLRWNRDLDQLISRLDDFLAKQQEARRKEEEEAGKERQREAEARHVKEAEEGRRREVEAQRKQAEEERLGQEAGAAERLRREAEDSAQATAIHEAMQSREEPAQGQQNTPPDGPPPARQGGRAQEVVDKWGRKELGLLAAAMLLVGAIGGVVLLSQRREATTSPIVTATGTPSVAGSGQSIPADAAPSPLPAVTSRAGLLVLLPPGEFEMGSTEEEPDEQPVHTVVIREPFYLGRYEVTQAQWRAVMGSVPSQSSDGDDLPVENVSWNDAQEFILKLNEQDAEYTYRLPSEAEWEYACSKGEKQEQIDKEDKDAWERIFLSKGWFDRNSDKQTHPVGQKEPNDFGLYDMHGNVWEWCGDRYHPNYRGAPPDGSTWSSGGDGRRILRGGSWDSYAYNCRCADRARYAPTARGPRAGLRLAAVSRR